MSGLQVSPALLRTLPRLALRADPAKVRDFESGQATRPATRAHERQQVGIASHGAVKRAARARPTPEHRQKDIERRRRWAGGGSLPPEVRSHYTEAERAALSVIADECKRSGFCAKCIDEIARLAGVSRTTVQNALRKASSKERRHLSVTQRPQRHGKSLTNIVKVVCSSWLGWMARAIGFKRLSTSETPVRISLSKGVEVEKEALESESAGPFEDLLYPLRVGNGPEPRCGAPRSPLWRTFGGALRC